MSTKNLRATSMGLSAFFCFTMKQGMVVLVVTFFITFFGQTTFAQRPPQTGFDTNETKLPVMLGIPPKATLSLAGKDLQISLVPTEDAVTQRVTPKEASIWINYSSVVEPNSTNAIYVSMGMSNVPAEITIRLKIDPYVGNGSGQVGIPTEPIILGTFPQPIITNIGSCYTGKGEGTGHKLTYSWELSPNYDPELLRLEDLQIATDIIYTIVNN